MQLLTGLWLAGRLAIPLDSRWFVVVIGLYVFVGCCWLPVLWIQIRVRDLAGTAASEHVVHRLMLAWTTLGICAFSVVLVIFWLMVFKPGISG